MLSERFFVNYPLVLHSEDIGKFYTRRRTLSCGNGAGLLSSRLGQVGPHCTAMPNSRLRGHTWLAHRGCNAVAVAARRRDGVAVRPSLNN